MGNNKKIEILNIELYKKVTEEIKNKYPKHSAYRSGLIVKTYKRLGGQYSGDKNTGKLRRWFKEHWTNEAGNIGYEYDQGNTLYRPNIRVSEQTPTTWQELTQEEIQKAKEQKQKKGRVKKMQKTFKLNKHLPPFYKIQEH